MYFALVYETDDSDDVTWCDTILDNHSTSLRVQYISKHIKKFV